MIQQDLHIHTSFCDGKDSVEAMVQSGIKIGLKSIGISSHCPLKYDNDWTMRFDQVEKYIDEVNKIKEKYKDQIQVFLGMEVDYYMDNQSYFSGVRQWLNRMDYIIGSIHTMGVIKNGLIADIDYTPEIFQQGIISLFHDCPRQFVETYYSSISNMVKTERPDIVGHIDIIKKNNVEGRFFNVEADWYRDAWESCLDIIKKSNSIVEINTGGLYRYGEEFLYPSIEIIKGCSSRSIPITLTSDSHECDAVGYAFKQILDLIASIGYKTIMIFDGKQWREEKISI